MSVHDLWGGKRTGVGRRWEVRWRDRGQQRKRRFSVRSAADAWNATVTLRPGEGAAAAVTVGDLHTGWREAKAGLAQTTLAGYDSAWKHLVAPAWGSTPATGVTAGAVQVWVGKLQSTSESRARTALSVLSGIMRHATMLGVVAANPCSSVRWPPVSRAEVVPLTADEVGRLAEAMRPHDLAVWTLATTGVRFGELAGFWVRDLDVKARRLVVSRSITTVGGRLVESLPKSRKRRVVPIVGWLADDLAKTVRGRAATDPLFPTPSGGVWRKTTWRRLWVGEPKRGKKGALELAGLPLTTRVHDLRHTAAVRMLEAGESSKTVQEILGHASEAMTLDLYGRWRKSDLDSAARVWENVKRP